MPAAALNIPDELTCELMWKDKKREFNFDTVFQPGTSQDKVRACVIGIVGRKPTTSLTGVQILSPNGAHLEGCLLWAGSRMKLG